MKTEVRILFALAAVALAAGWLGLHRGNEVLQARIYGRGPSAWRAEAQARPAGTERAGDRGVQPDGATPQEVSR